MGGVLNEAKEEIKTSHLRNKRQHSQYGLGVANVEDLTGYDNGTLSEQKAKKSKKTGKNRSARPVVAADSSSALEASATT